MASIKEGTALIKLSDYVARFLAEHGVAVVFGYQGSSVAHTINSISRSPIQFVETRHEQAAAFAACGYALQKDDVGVALSCSGPGALNLISGIADAWYDSIPCLFLTGQVSRSGIRTGEQIRQLGFQETDICSIVAPITKYAVTVMEPQTIRYHLEKAWAMMCSGRKGPVLLDIPHDVQASIIDETALAGYEEVPEASRWIPHPAQDWGSRIGGAKRPLLLLGKGASGLRDSGLLEQFCEKYHLPVVCSYLGKDVFDNTKANFIGVIGAYGNRLANLAVHYSDLILSLGSRLDGRQTGDDLQRFGEQAEIFCVDIDSGELGKLPQRYQTCCADAQTFLEDAMAYSPNHNGTWLPTLVRWKESFAPEQEYPADHAGVNPNCLLKRVSEDMVGCPIVADVGQNQIWVNASAVVGKGGRLIQSGGLGAMGFALPAAVGASFTKPDRAVVCISGDGGFQMNIQELQTIQENNCAIHCYVMNNQSLGLIRVYQQKALQGNLVGSVDGFGNPNYEMIARAYGMAYYRIREDGNIAEALQKIRGCTGPCLIEVDISERSVCYPEPTYKQLVYQQSPLMDVEVIQRFESEIGYETKV